MTLGLPFAVAGTLVNNLAFWGALRLVYGWVAARHGLAAARWATAVLAWCPLSLFGTVAYTEGLFLLWSTAALRAFDCQQYGQTALWGALATATRPTGLALLPAFWIVAWRERRPEIAYLAGGAAVTGVLLFSVYCGLRLGDPLAFIHAQKAWRPALGVDWAGWLKLISQVTSGPVDRFTGAVKDPLHPLLFTLTIAAAGLLLKFRTHLGGSTGYGFCGLVLLQWILGGDSWLNAMAIFGGAYLLWQSRQSLRPIVLIYGYCALALILSSGSTYSLNRIAYGVVSWAIALGILLARYPRWGYPTLIFFAIILASFALRFAQQQWVA